MLWEAYERLKASMALVLCTLDAGHSPQAVDCGMFRGAGRNTSNNNAEMIRDVTLVRLKRCPRRHNRTPDDGQERQSGSQWRLDDRGKVDARLSSAVNKQDAYLGPASRVRSK